MGSALLLLPPLLALSVLIDARSVGEVHRETSPSSSQPSDPRVPSKVVPPSYRDPHSLHSHQRAHYDIGRTRHHMKPHHHGAVRGVGAVRTETSPSHPDPSHPHPHASTPAAPSPHPSSIVPLEWAVSNRDRECVIELDSKAKGKKFAWNLCGLQGMDTDFNLCLQDNADISFCYKFAVMRRLKTSCQNLPTGAEEQLHAKEQHGCRLLSNSEPEIALAHPVDSADPQKGLELDYVDGDFCGETSERRGVKIRLECSRGSEGQPQTDVFQEVLGRSTCLYTFVLRGPSGCPHEFPIGQPLSPTDIQTLTGGTAVPHSQPQPQLQGAPRPQPQVQVQAQAPNLSPQTTASLSATLSGVKGEVNPPAVPPGVKGEPMRLDGEWKNFFNVPVAPPQQQPEMNVQSSTMPQTQTVSTPPQTQSEPRQYRNFAPPSPHSYMPSNHVSPPQPASPAVSMPRPRTETVGKRDDAAAGGMKNLLVEEMNLPEIRRMGPCTHALYICGSAFLVYIVFGMYYRHSKYGVTGWDLVPNAALWHALPSLVYDGCCFSLWWFQETTRPVTGGLFNGLGDKGSAGCGDLEKLPLGRQRRSSNFGGNYSGLEGGFSPLGATSIRERDEEGGDGRPAGFPLSSPS